MRLSHLALFQSQCFQSCLQQRSSLQLKRLPRLGAAPAKLQMPANPRFLPADFLYLRGAPLESEEPKAEAALPRNSGAVGATVARMAMASWWSTSRGQTYPVTRRRTGQRSLRAPPLRRPACTACGFRQLSGSGEQAKQRMTFSRRSRCSYFADTCDEVCIGKGGRNKFSRQTCCSDPAVSALRQKLCIVRPGPRRDHACLPAALAFSDPIHWWLPVSKHSHAFFGFREGPKRAARGQLGWGWFRGMMEGPEALQASPFGLGMFSLELRPYI